MISIVLLRLSYVFILVFGYEKFHNGMFINSFVLLADKIRYFLYLLI